MEYTDDQIKKILTREWETRLALKRAKATEFLAAAARGAKPTEAWQAIALSTADMEREWEIARAEKYALWFMAGQRPTDGGTEDS